MKASHDHVFQKALKGSGLKVTPARLALLTLLEESPKPLSIATIAKQLSSVADQATVYRALEAFTEADIVHKVDFHDSHTYYELTLDRAHHHHIVCESCGTVEDVKVCDTKGLESAALKQCKKFKAVKSHSLEFFGLCSECV